MPSYVDLGFRRFSRDLARLRLAGLCRASCPISCPTSPGIRLPALPSAAADEDPGPA